MMSDMPAAGQQHEMNILSTEFVTAIKKDNVKELQKILEKSSAECEEILLNGIIQEDVTFKDCPTLVQEVAVTHAIYIAVLEQAYECFEFLLESEVDMSPIQKEDDNILHYLVYSSSLNPNKKVFKMYGKILEHSDVMKRREFLRKRNRNGLTPLELAANLACSKLFVLFLYTERVYRQIQKSCGKAVTNTFTFMKDESDKATSFLWQLANCKADCPSAAIVEMLENKVVHTYIKKKFRNILPIALLWFALRMIPLVGGLKVEFAIWHAYSSKICTLANISNQMSFSKWLHNKYYDQNSYFYLLAYTLHGFAMIIFDVTEVIYLCIREKKSVADVTHLRQHRVVNTGFYRLVTFLSAVCTLCIGTSELTGKPMPGSDKETAAVIFHLFNLIFALVSAAYFIQLWPLIGYFIIGFQKMLAAVLRFVLLQLLVFLAFSILFTFVRVYSCTASRKVCDRIMNFYDTFLMMVNMVSDVVPNDSRCLTWGEHSLEVLHVSYVFIVAIMVINYLIAVMSSAYTNFSFLQNSVQPLHRLHFALIIERRLNMIRKLIPKRFRMKRDTEDPLAITEVCQDFEIIDSLTLPPKTSEQTAEG